MKMNKNGKKVILFPLLYYRECLDLFDYDLFCEELMKVAINPGVNVNNSIDYLFLVYFKDRGGRLIPDQRKYYSYNNSIIPFFDFNYFENRNCVE
ncbi:MAG: hypothetical protein IJT00_02500, partial [Lachnospiraceae bacterium]|nr:hypothetical protein [Lachnospiraceae bacterium]